MFAKKPNSGIKNKHDLVVLISRKLTKKYPSWYFNNHVALKPEIPQGSDKLMTGGSEDKQMTAEMNPVLAILIMLLNNAQKKKKKTWLIENVCQVIKQEIFPPELPQYSK